MLDLQTIGIAMDTSGLKDAQKELDKTTEAAKKTADTADKTTAAFGKTTGAAHMLAMGAKAVAGAWLTWKVLDFVRDTTLLNARFETMGVVMGIAGNNAGVTGAQMDNLAKSLEGTGISMLQSRNALTQLATANIDLANATKLGRAAQDLAVVGNLNSSDAMERLIYGLKSGQTEVLRTMGLQVNFEQSYRSLANEQHKNVNALTEQERMQARVNMVLQQAARYAGIYEEAMGTAGKQMKSAERYVEDFKVKVGEVFNEALTVGVMAFTKGITDANGKLDELAKRNQLDAWGAGVADTLAALADNVWNLIGALKILKITYGLTTGDVELKQYGKEVDAVLATEDRFQKALTARRAAQKAADPNQQADSEVARLMKRQKDTLESNRIASAAAAAKAMTPTGRVSGGRSGGESEAQKLEKDYQSLTLATKKLLAEQQLEIAGAAPLTQSQKLMAEFIEDLGGKYRKLSVAKQLAHVNDLIDMATNEDQIKQAKEYATELDKLMGVFRSSREEGAVLQIQANMSGQLPEDIAKAVSNYRIQADLEKSIADIRKSSIPDQQKEVLIILAQTNATQLLANTDKVAVAAQDARTRATQSAKAAADEYIATLERQAEREIKGVGMGNAYRAEQAGLSQIEDKLTAKKAELMNSLNSGGLDKANYDAQIAIAEASASSEVEIYRRTIAAKKVLQADWRTGEREATANYLADIANVADSTNALFTKAFKGMEDALVEFVQTGKLDFGQLADSIIADLIRIQIQQSIMQPLISGMSASGGIFGFLGSMFGFAGGGYTGDGARVGGVDGQGGYMAIVHPQETVIDHSRGQTLGGSTNVTVNVIESADKAGTQQTRRDSGGGNVIDVFVAQIKAGIASDIARGAGPIPNAMNATYGLNRVAGAY